jgi:hypothetical protein
MSIAVSRRAVSSSSADCLVRNQVRILLQRSQDAPAMLERRQDRRHPLPALMTVYPAQGGTDAPAQVVVGKDISERGLGFFHQQPIPFRRAIVVYEVPGAGQAAFLIDISWCRFTQQGWYESGGRLLEAVAPPERVPIAAAS